MTEAVETTKEQPTTGQTSKEEVGQPPEYKVGDKVALTEMQKAELTPFNKEIRDITTAFGALELTYMEKKAELTRKLGSAHANKQKKVNELGKDVGVVLGKDWKFFDGDYTFLKVS